MIPASPELASQIQSVELRSRSMVGNLRNLKQQAGQLAFQSPADFENYLSGKDVLDVGSGLNGLAIDVILKKLQARVISVNPAFNDPLFEDTQKDVIYLFPHFFPRFSPEEIEAARVEANRNTRALFAHDLSTFANKSFDVVIDNFAVAFYALESGKLAFAKSMSEMARVCRGRIRVGDKFSEYVYGGSTPNWKEGILRDLGLNYTPYKGGFEVVIN